MDNRYILIHIHAEIDLDGEDSMHTFCSQLCSLRRPKKKIDTHVPMNILRAQILVLNTISQSREPGFLGEVVNSRARAGKININRFACSKQE